MGYLDIFCRRFFNIKVSRFPTRWFHFVTTMAIILFSMAATSVSIAGLEEGFFAHFVMDSDGSFSIDENVTSEVGTLWGRMAHNESQLSVSEIFGNEEMASGGKVALTFSCVSLLFLLIDSVATISAFWFRLYYVHIVNIWVTLFCVISLFVSWVPYNYLYVLHTGTQPSCKWAYISLVVSSGLMSYVLLVSLLMCLYDREWKIALDRERGKDD